MSNGEGLTSHVELERLQKQVEQVQQENKVLNIRAQALQVLGKVLQDSQDDNARLKQELDQLKAQLVGKGVDPSQAQLSMLRHDSDNESRSTVTEHSGSALSSMSRGSRTHDYINVTTALDPELISMPRGAAAHDYVNVTTASGPQSVSAGFSSLFSGDLHIKEIRAEFQHIKGEADELIINARQLCDDINTVGDDGDAEIRVKLGRLSCQLKEYAKEAGTRETLSSALASEEEQIRDKLLAMEAEQASHENVVQQLKEKVYESKEELERIQDEIKFYQEAVLVKRVSASPREDKRPSLSGSVRSAARSSSEQPIMIKSPLLRSGAGTCDGCDQLQRQLNELQKQVLEVTRERDESFKLKEEILDVNHKWDTQYKMLQVETGRQITDLKQQLEAFKSRESQRRIDQQMISDPANAGRNFQAYQAGFMRPLTPQTGPMDQQPPHYPSTGAAALQTSAPGPAHNMPSWTGSASNSQGISPELVDQIEVLKQQLRVYADDFATERNDRERVQAEKEAMREELNAVKEQVQTLEQQVQIYEEDFKREQREKENLQQQMRAMGHSASAYPRQDMSQRARAVAEQQARVQAIKEVHDREKNRLLREQQELQQHVFAKQPPPPQYTQPSSQYLPGYGGMHMGYTNQQLRQQQWERQNLPLVSRGASVPSRGPIGNPSDQRSASESMFRGGEVLPDRGEDVVDSASDVKEPEGVTAGAGVDGSVTGLEALSINECPRCLRRFDDDSSDSILQHIEKCIS